jgi:hypothetical protein
MNFSDILMPRILKELDQRLGRIPGAAEENPLLRDPGDFEVEQALIAFVYSGHNEDRAGIAREN